MKKIREVVIPGEIIGETKSSRSSFGTYEQDGHIISKFVGIPKKGGVYLSVIPLSGVYIPKPQDKIIGVVTEVEKMGWIVDVNSPWEAFLSLSEAVNEFVDVKRVSLTRFFDVKDIVYAQISDARRGDIQLTMKSPICRKLKDGAIVKITPSKVPRLIGREGSMVNLIKEKTGTIIRVGQNGIVWVSGERIEKAIKAVKLIDKKSHVFGLTDEISKMLGD